MTTPAGAALAVPLGYRGRVIAVGGPPHSGKSVFHIGVELARTW